MKVNYIYSNISNNNQQYLLHIILKCRKPTMNEQYYYVQQKTCQLLYVIL